MITKEQVEHIAKLAKLALSEEELLKFQKDLSSVLDYFEVLNTLDTSSVSPLTHAVSLENVSREDEAQKPNGELVQELLEAAPAQDQNFLQVKEIWKHSP